MKITLEFDNIKEYKEFININKSVKNKNEEVMICDKKGLIILNGEINI
ncbi:hypothetical protein IC218_20285 [Clostridioides sp. ES-S-0005-03]|nr:hypothetical protein [Clostridioides sp. ES-S-0005-03]